MAAALRSGITAVTLSVLAGCVSAGTHEELKRKYDEATGALQERGARLEAESGRLSQSQAELKALHGQHADARARVAELEGQLERAQAELDGLRTQLAAVVRDRKQLTSTTKQLTDALRQLSARKAQADARVAEFRGLLERFRDMIDAGKLQVRVVDGRMVLALPTDVLFDSGSAELSDVGKAAIQELATRLVGMRGKRFQVEGHTDNVPIKTARYPSNWELSSARALGVVKAMCAAGLDSAHVSAAAFGEHHPVASNDAEEGRRQNRRIEVVFQPDLSLLPGFEALESMVSQ